MKYSLRLPQVWMQDQIGIKDPVEAYETMTHVTQLADELGYESVWLVDHFHTVPRPSQEFTFDCWTSTAALARNTKRIRIGQLVTCNSYRNPALLAKMASTVDVLSHGRLNFGIGAGWYEQEYHAYGYNYPIVSERLRYLHEAVQIILNMWTQEEVVFEGKHYQVRGAINSPKGVQRPHIPLLIGGSGERVTLKLVAQYADACNISGDLPTIRHKFDVIKRHCENIGRDYESIHRTVSTLCIIGETDEQVQSKIPRGLGDGFAEYLKNGLVGTPDSIRKGLAEYEQAGVQEVILNFLDIAKPDSIRLFANEFLS
jgi:F420-dependent oxidoreductase-like protein